MRPLPVAYVILIIFVALERALRRDAAARTLQSTADDRDTTRWIGITYGASVGAGLFAPLLNLLDVAHVPPRLQWLGPLCMIAGVALRMWSALCLGKYYTRTLRMAEHQPVVQRGPYRVVRHPGYAGDLLMWIGFGLATGNALMLGTVAAAMSVAYARRIEAEEAMLERELGAEYAAYQRRTSRLVPRIF